MAGNTLTRLQDARAQHAKHARRTSLELMLIENRTLVG